MNKMDLIYYAYLELEIQLETKYLIVLKNVMKQEFQSKWSQGIIK